MPPPRIELGTSRSGSGRSDPLSYAGDETLGRRGDLIPVGAHGFEPRTFRSQSERATKLRHTPCRVVEADAGLVPTEGFEPPHPKDLIYSQARLAIGAVPADAPSGRVVVPAGIEPATFPV